MSSSDEVLQPTYRIAPDGSRRSLDSPYEQGLYFGTIGLYRSGNPHPRDDKLNRRLWEKGFNDAVRGRP